MQAPRLISSLLSVRTGRVAGEPANFTVSTGPGRRRCGHQLMPVAATVAIACAISAGCRRAPTPNVELDEWWLCRTRDGQHVIGYGHSIVRIDSSAPNNTLILDDLEFLYGNELITENMRLVIVTGELPRAVAFSEQFESRAANGDRFVGSVSCKPDNGKFKWTRTSQGEREEDTIDVPADVFWSSSVGEFVRTEPLTRGRTYAFRMFIPAGKKFVDRELRWVGREWIETPKGSVEAFLVEERENDEVRVSFWLNEKNELIKIKESDHVWDRSDEEMVKTAYTQPAFAGEPTVTSQPSD